MRPTWPCYLRAKALIGPEAHSDISGAWEAGGGDSGTLAGLLARLLAATGQMLVVTGMDLLIPHSDQST